MTAPRLTLARLVPTAALIALGAVGLTGCGSSSTASMRTAAVKAATPTGVSYPLEVRNCGRTLHFDRAPQRIVSGWPSSTELLIDLGVGERVVGKYNTASGAADDAHATAYGAIPTLGENAPSRESLLAARPDLIWADGDYLFDGKQLPTIEELNADGIQVMILSGFCTSDATKATIRDVDTDLNALGNILDVPAKADELLAQADATLNQTSERVAGSPPVPVAMISNYEGTIYAYEGVYSDLARLAGANNVYAGVLPKSQYYAEISAEDLLRRNPSTIVYLTSGTETEAQAKAFLAKKFATLSAVRDGKVVVLPQVDATNLRGVRGVQSLAAALHPVS